MTVTIYDPKDHSTWRSLIVIDKNDNGDLYIIRRDPEYGNTQILIEKDLIPLFLGKLMEASI